MAEPTQKDRERAGDCGRHLHGSLPTAMCVHCEDRAQLVADVREERDKDWTENRLLPALEEKNPLIHGLYLAENKIRRQAVERMESAEAELAKAKADLEEKDYGSARLRLLFQIQEHVPEAGIASGLITGVQVCVNLIVDLKAKLEEAKADTERLDWLLVDLQFPYGPADEGWKRTIGKMGS